MMAMGAGRGVVVCVRWMGWVKLSCSARLRTASFKKLPRLSPEGPARGLVHAQDRGSGRRRLLLIGLRLLACEVISKYTSTSSLSRSPYRAAPSPRRFPRRHRRTSKFPQLPYPREILIIPLGCHLNRIRIARLTITIACTRRPPLPSHPFWQRHSTTSST